MKDVETGSTQLSVGMRQGVAELLVLGAVPLQLLDLVA
jgi:hypothetical protein